MKSTTLHNERGQALVLIVLAAIGLFGFAALAIDGSVIFSDKRHAQNAADTSALDAALARTRGGDWVNEGLARADSNGYDDNGTSNDVTVQLCSDVAANCTGLPTGADPAEYIQVKIRSDVNLYFARVIGRPKATNYVQAVARAVPSDYDEMFSGNAVVGLNPHDCASIKVGGSTGTVITGGGIFAMSDCEDNAFDGHGNGGSLTVPSICAVGGIDPGNLNFPNGTPPMNEGCTPPPDIVEPDPECSQDATWSGNVMQPGRYSGQFPPNHVDTLMPGIYCIDGNFKMSSASLTGHDVVLRFDDGGIDWNGGDELHLFAPTEGPYQGLLIYLPSTSNCDTLTINGNSASEIAGSILAPCSLIKVNGTGDSGINGQIIGDIVEIAGNSGASIHYDDELNWNTLTQPEIEFNQ